MADDAAIPAREAPTIDEEVQDLHVVSAVGTDRLPHVKESQSRTEPEPIASVAACFVVIDPLVAFVPGKYNLYRDD